MALHVIWPRHNPAVVVVVDDHGGHRAYNRTLHGDPIVEHYRHLADLAELEQVITRHQARHLRKSTR